MAYVPLINLVPQFFDNLGDPLVGGTLNAYVAGTSTPTNMYSDISGTVAGTSVTLDSRGEPATIKLIWLDTEVIYKFVLKDANGSIIWTEDNIVSTSIADGSITNAKLANNSVTAGKIAASAVTESKLGDNSVTAAKLANGGQELIFRNRFLNGALWINQRNAGSQTITGGAALAYTVDRWYAYSVGGNVTGSPSSSSAFPYNPYLLSSVSGSVTKVGFVQRIESINCRDMAGQNATLSAYFACDQLSVNVVTWTAWRANTTDTFGTLASPTRTQIATGTFTINNVMTRYSATFAIPTAATTGIEIEFAVGALTNGVWKIGNPQLEIGSNLTPFEIVEYSYDLHRCRRYYEEESGTTSLRAITTASTVFPSRGFKNSKRAIPTLTITLGAGSGATYAASTEGFYQSADNTVAAAISWSASSEL